ncbi:YraN family protein [Pseudocnuella soli]|uniref:YraN family protein n=1 Tax=Pseudocnuella soli TaxID=2502779 RepID=UPI00105044DE|nr:YraN family protein [Pseudocnuella soli]
MALHNQLGKEGEQLAADYLLQNGFAITHRNWRHGQWEIDIIAMRHGVLHFVEVKYRTGNKYGHPEQSVTKQKFRFLQRAAEQYLYLNPQFKKIRFDILSINTVPGAAPEFFFIEDVYF